MIGNEFYTITFIKNDLIFIKWHQTPLNGSLEGVEFVKTLQQILDEAPAPIYILSDLTSGSLTDVVQIRRLSHLAKHANYGGSVAFGDGYQTSVYAGLFASVAQRADEIQPNLQKALAHLDEIQPGITAGIDLAELKELTK